MENDEAVLEALLVALEADDDEDEPVPPELDDEACDDALVPLPPDGDGHPACRARAAPTSRSPGKVET